MLLWAASIMMIVLAAVGTRVAFALPLDLRANWIFRVIGVRGGLESLAASRRALLLLSVAPVWLATAVVCLGLWPGRQNAAHLVVLGLLGMILADICLLGFRKIPFTCSYLPGKSRVHMVFLGALGVLLVGSKAPCWNGMRCGRPAAWRLCWRCWPSCGSRQVDDGGAGAGGKNRNCGLRRRRSRRCRAWDCTGTE